MESQKQVKQTPENYIKEIRRKTRRVFSTEQKISIVVEGMRAETSDTRKVQPMPNEKISKIHIIRFFIAREVQPAASMTGAIVHVSVVEPICKQRKDYIEG